MDAIPDEPSLQCQCTFGNRVVERVSEFVLRGHNLASPFLVALDLMGTFVFALSGAVAAAALARDVSADAALDAGRVL